MTNGYHNITKAEIRTDRGLKTLFLEWDDEVVEMIWGGCLDKIKEALK